MDRKEKKPKKRRWKFLRTGLKSDYNGFQWEIGKWETTECERLCVGFNCSNRIIDAMRYVSGEILAEVESSGKCFEDDSKSTHEKMRIVNAWNWRKEDSVELAIYAAEMVIHIFEDKNPYDDRPRKAIEAAKSWLAGKSAYAATAYAVANAANAAANAANANAYAAAYAVANAANAAAAAAARAAANAAYAAAAAANAAANAANVANTANAAYAAADYAAAADKSVTDKIESWLRERVKKLKKYKGGTIEARG
jgi:hypothetical protein